MKTERVKSNNLKYSKEKWMKYIGKDWNQIFIIDKKNNKIRLLAFPK